MKCGYGAFSPRRQKGEKGMRKLPLLIVAVCLTILFLSTFAFAFVSPPAIGALTPATEQLYTTMSIAPNSVPYLMTESPPAVAIAPENLNYIIENNHSGIAIDTLAATYFGTAMPPALEVRPHPKLTI